MPAPALSPFGVWLAEHVTLVAQLLGGGATLGTAWALLRRHGRQVACTVVHVGLAAQPARMDDVIFGVLDRDSRTPEPRLRTINNRAHAPDIARREQSVTDAQMAATALRHQVELLRAEQTQRADTIGEQLAPLAQLPEAISGINATLDALRRGQEQQHQEQREQRDVQATHGAQLAATGATVSALADVVRKWTGPEQRVAPDPKKPRSRGGQRKTDPA